MAAYLARFKASRLFSVAAGFYRTCAFDGIIEHLPVEHVRRPAEQLRAGRLVRLWVRQLPLADLRAKEERLITAWELRRIGWNRG